MQSGRRPEGGPPGEGAPLIARSNMLLSFWEIQLHQWWQQF
jgi:hypothetical protein